MSRARCCAAGGTGRRRRPWCWAPPLPTPAPGAVSCAIWAPANCRSCIPTRRGCSSSAPRSRWRRSSNPCCAASAQRISRRTAPRPPRGPEDEMALLDASTLGPGRLGFSDEKDLDAFVDRLGKFERGEITPDAWKAFRLVNGVYSQRQEGDAMMVRVKIPQGVLTPAQLRALAEVAERWSTGRGHLTTRQNLQLHFVKLADTTEALRVLADAGLTTREACGNSVRNVTTCPYAGASALEPFDPTPYAEAVTRDLLRGPLSSSLPRKFKIAFGGCCGTDCVGASFNDIGFLARVRDGVPGFRVTLGGGLSTLRRAGILAHEFAPASEAVEIAEAVVRVFNQTGDRQHKHKPRLKFGLGKR